MFEVRRQAWRVLDPEGAALRWQRDVEAMIRSSSLPLYGLPPAWEGQRFLGGWGTGGTGVNQVTLGHGSPDDQAGPLLRVEVARRQPVDADPEYVRARLVQELRNMAPPPPSVPPPVSPPSPGGTGVSVWAVPAGPGLSEQGDFEPEADPPDEAWRTTRIRVNGQVVEFSCLVEGDDWIGRTTLAEVSVTVSAHHFPMDQVDLRRVSDLDPYFALSR